MKRIARPTRSQRGQVLIIMGVLMVGIMGLTGLVTDVGAYFYQNRVQQNAAEAASHAATAYWAGKFTTATDQEIYCIARLYASSASYGSLPCQPAAGTVPDNAGQGVNVYYVDKNNNQLGPVGVSGALLPSAIPSNSSGGQMVATGIRVTTSATSGAFFSKIFNISGFAVNDTATNRLGSVGGVNNPQNGIYVFPAVFQQNSYTSNLHYPLGSGVSTNFGGLPCKASSDFCWSGLQCTGNHGNNIAKDWLTKVNDCPGQPTLLATSTSTLCTSTPPSPTANCQLEVDNGTRDVNFTLTQSGWSGVAIVPIVNGVNSSEPITQFAYFFITGTGGSGSNSYISGYYIDPLSMPPLSTVLSGPCNPVAGPCGVSGA